MPKPNFALTDGNLEVRMAVAQKIRALRGKSGVSQKAVAAHFGIDKGRMCKYETGLLLFPKSWVIELATLLNVRPIRIAELYFGEEGCLRTRRSR